MKSQKLLSKFGNFCEFGSLSLAGDYKTENPSIQDVDHITKRMKNTLYAPCDVLRMGNKFAALGHLVMVYKMFNKNQHHLVLSDLDPTDKMNYKYDYLNIKFILFSYFSFFKDASRK
jgi:hypothetical protein